MLASPKEHVPFLATDAILPHAHRPPQARDPARVLRLGRSPGRALRVRRLPARRHDGRENLGHSLLAGNINRQLGNRLAGSGCRPLGPDAGVATVGDTVRCPDAIVTRTPFNGRDRLVPNPVVVFEVISPSSVRTALSRDSGNEPFRAAGLAEDDTLSLPEIGIEIPVAAIYEGLTFGEAPAL